MTSRKQSFQGNFFMNERQPNSPEHEDRLGWCGLLLNASERISEQALFFFHSKDGRCSFWGMIHCDVRRSPWWASRDGLSMITFALTPSWLVWILTARPVWLYFSSFLFVLFCFWTQNFIYYTSDSCVWFLLPYVSSQSNCVKTFKTRTVHFVFSLRIFVSAPISIT